MAVAKRALLLLGILCLPGYLAGLAGCSSADVKPVSETAKIEGSVVYRERMLLPPGAEVEVTLQDEAKMDVAAEVIAQQRFIAEGGPPYEFSLEYNPQKLQESGRYGLRARIESDGKLLFTNDTHISAFGDVAGQPVEILVKRVAGAAPSAAPKSLIGTNWLLTEIDGAPAPQGAGGRPAELVLLADERRASGYSGCNRFMGEYLQKKDQLSFDKLASTMMACAEGMELEQQFLSALRAATRYEISGDSLVLVSADERVLLRFQAGQSQ